MFGRNRDEQEVSGEDASEPVIAAVPKTPSRDTTSPDRPSIGFWITSTTR